ncbi:MAG: hypothetical protein HC804_07665 [Anaerolineae bacterium]|nr:hypothetical protein [Anaerolineae bacterium]
MIKRHAFLLLMLSGLLLLVASVSARSSAGAPNVYLPLIMGGSGSGGNNANEWVPPYTGQFRYGLNPGYYGNGWTDNTVYQLCYDAGCRSARNTLPDAFIAQWGVGIRLSTFQHITSDLQFGDITTFLQTPRDEWRDTAVYDGHQSKLWQGMYEPIWDNGENGTAVNDNNRFALYVSQIVGTYGDYISFYEIINEPDYTYSNYGWIEPGQPGSWWDNPPQAADTPNVRTPIFQYIRLLRIAYEVVKRDDPTGYVTPAASATNPTSMPCCATATTPTAAPSRPIIPSPAAPILTPSASTITPNLARATGMAHNGFPTATATKRSRCL